MSRLVGWLDRRLYPGYEGDWDHALFRDEVRQAIRPDHDVLDLGAGAGIVSHLRFRGLARRVCGIDPDPRVASNPNLDDGVVGCGEAILFPDGCFDLVLACNVLEHLADPVQVFREVARVLRPGGRFLVKTPNRRHYVPLIARMTPTWVHKKVNALRGREEEDTFPTVYRVNTPAQLERVAATAGLEVEWVRLVEGRPEYLRLTAPTYLAGWLWERAVNTVPGLRGFRCVLFASMRRP